MLLIERYIYWTQNIPLTKILCGCICHYMNHCLLYIPLNSLLYNFMDQFVLSLFSLCNCSLICFRADGLSSLHLKYALLLETERFSWCYQERDAVLRISSLYGRDPQICPTPAEFSSNPNQTHLSMLIRVFKIIRKSQVGEFDQGWS